MGTELGYIWGKMYPNIFWFAFKLLKQLLFCPKPKITHNCHLYYTLIALKCSYLPSTAACIHLLNGATLNRP